MVLKMILIIFDKGKINVIVILEFAYRCFVILLLNKNQSRFR